MTSISQPSYTAPAARPAPLPAETGLPEHIDLYAVCGGPFETNCYILVDTSGPAPHPATVIDPTMGAAAAVAALAEEHTFHVDAAVLTHGHIDHYRDAEFFATPVSVHAADRPLIEEGLAVGPFGALFAIDGSIVPADLRTLGETVTIAGLEFDIHHMPGHSPGSCMLQHDRTVLGGDVLFRGGIGRTDLPGSSPHDMVRSLRRMLEMWEDDIIVLPGHGPATTMGEERRSNGFLQSVSSS